MTQRYKTIFYHASKIFIKILAVLRNRLVYQLGVVQNNILITVFFGGVFRKIGRVLGRFGEEFGIWVGEEVDLE